jgi:hypothetical protein
MKANLVLDDQSKNYLFTFYRELILNKNNLTNIKLSVNQENAKNSNDDEAAKTQREVKNNQNSRKQENTMNINQKNYKNETIESNERNVQENVLNKITSYFGRKEYFKVLDLINNYSEKNSLQPISEKYLDCITYSLFQAVSLLCKKCGNFFLLNIFIVE